MLHYDLFLIKAWEAGVLEFASQLVRYFGFAGGIYILLWKTPHFLENKISRRGLKDGQVRNEIRHSLVTMLLFSITGWLTFLANEKWGVLKLYANADEYGWLYFFLSPFLYLLLHDAYFYWTHRLMHHPRWFRKAHYVHHQSVTPTPLTMYSFHVGETLVENAIFPLLFLFVPIHPYAFFVTVFFAGAINILGHLGYELFGNWFWKTPLSEVFMSATFHDLHHGGGFRTNYGFYTRIWDRLCGTEDPRYQEFLDRKRGKGGPLGPNRRSGEGSGVDAFEPGRVARNHSRELTG